ncbi:MAG: dihydroorotate dehydrogenase electron transfer subunit [Brevefilum sp.]
MGLFSSYRIREVQTENAVTRTLVFDAPLRESLPGQFVMVWLPNIGEKPFSISGNDPLALTIADVGPVSHALCMLIPGERVWVRGPLGTGFSLTSKPSLLAGGGYGAAPLSLLAGHLRLVGASVTVVLGARTRDGLMMATQFESLGCTVYLATEDGSAGTKGLVTTAVKRAWSEMRSNTLYACGPTGMLLALGEFAKAKHIEAQLSFEALIRCGVGLCGSCELSEAICTKLGIPTGFLVCQDGPVAFIK